MKLFLTATSERGKPVTKSGNEWLKIEVIDENREVIFSKTIAPKGVELCNCLECTNKRGETNIPF